MAAIRPHQYPAVPMPNVPTLLNPDRFDLEPESQKPPVCPFVQKSSVGLADIDLETSFSFSIAFFNVSQNCDTIAASPQRARRNRVGPPKPVEDLVGFL